jgi:DNA-binding Lrp family transcriptional regulator
MKIVTQLRLWTSNRLARVTKLKDEVVITGVALLLVHQQVAASEFSKKACNAINAIFDNDMVSVAAFVAVVAMLMSSLLSEGGLKEKSGYFKAGMIISALLNVPWIVGQFTGRSTIC